MSPLLLALCSNISFATASIFFTTYSKRTSSAWMNFYKAFVACLCFAIVCTAMNYWIPLPTKTIGFLIVSGLLGLMIGDIFLLKSFTHLGSGRVLMLFGFQPLLIGLLSFIFLNQSFPLARLAAVVLLIGCLLSFSLESLKEKGHWDSKGLLYALIGVCFDAVGILLTRAAFENSTEMSPFLANFVRTGITVVGFSLMAMIPAFSFSVIKPWNSLSVKDKRLVTFASFLGTFMSLSFYLMAVQKGHLATISAIAGTSPLFATLFENALGKRKFSKYLFFGVVFFVGGVAILLLT